MKSTPRSYLIRGILLASLVAGGLALSAPQVSSAAQGPNWQSLQQKANSAIAGYDGAGSIVASAPKSSLTTTTNVNGTKVTIEEANYSASDGSGSYMVTLSWLNGTQLLVNLAPTVGSQTTMLELAPSTFKTDGVTHSQLKPATAGTTPGGIQPLADTSYFWIGGCEGWITAPQIEGSIYGPLIYGEGGYIIPNCPTTSASVLIGTYYWNGSQGIGMNNTAGGSGNPSASPGVYAIAYAGCASGGPVYFQTAGLYNALNEGSAGEYSDWALLSCAA